MNSLIMDTPIEELGFSTRSFNCLKRNNIHTLRQLRNTDIERLKSLKNIGKHSLDEILIFLDNDEGFISNSEINEVHIRKTDISIEDIKLSTRTYHCLKREGILYVSQLIQFNEKMLSRIKNLGSKSIQELLEVIDFYSTNPTSLFNKEDDISKIETLKYIYDEWNGINELAVAKEFYNVVNQIDDINFSNMDYTNIYRIPIVFNILCEYILNAMALSPAPVTLQYLNLKLPNHLNDNEVIELAIQRLVDNNLAEYFNGGYIEVRKSILTVAAETGGAKNEMLLMKINGTTLESIGTQFLVTRERVRQQISNQIKKLHFSVCTDRNLRAFREDKYGLLFSRYNFFCDSFTNIFNETLQTYNYLDVKYLHGEDKIEDIMDDSSTSVALRRSVEKYIYRDCINDNGVYIPKKRHIIVDYIIRTKCREETDFSSFLQYYNELILSQGMELDKNFAISQRTYENRLSVMNNVLWKFGRKFRYYPILEQDYTDLYDALSLEQYKDVELSTLKFFTDYPKIMAQYDIRDEYELHNLLKKTYKNDYLQFCKMPMIKFGEPNRENQVLEVFLEIAPASSERFGEALQKAYGIKKETAMANWVNIFSDCYQNGVYYIDFIPLLDEEISALKPLLIKEFYYISDIQDIYKTIRPNENITKINPQSIRQLGFKVAGNQVYSSKYGSASQYFEHLLTCTDEVNWRLIDSRLGGNISFTTVLSKLRGLYEIIEYTPYYYVNIRKINRFDVTKDNLYDYGNKVVDFVDDNSYFTVKSITNKGFMHYIDKLNYDEWFYSSESL